MVYFRNEGYCGFPIKKTLVAKSSLPPGIIFNLCLRSFAKIKNAKLTMYNPENYSFFVSHFHKIDKLIIDGPNVVNIICFAKLRAPPFSTRFFFFYLDYSQHGRKTHIEEGSWAYCYNRYTEPAFWQITSSDPPSAKIVSP